MYLLPEFAEIVLLIPGNGSQGLKSSELQHDTVHLGVLWEEGVLLTKGLHHRLELACL